MGPRRQSGGTGRVTQAEIIIRSDDRIQDATRKGLKELGLDDSVST